VHAPGGSREARHALRDIAGAWKIDVLVVRHHGGKGLYDIDVVARHLADHVELLAQRERGGSGKHAKAGRVPVSRVQLGRRPESEQAHFRPADMRFASGESDVRSGL
jgi:hypothetical protein